MVSVLIPFTLLAVFKNMNDYFTSKSNGCLLKTLALQFTVQDDYTLSDVCYVYIFVPVHATWMGTHAGI